MPLMREFHTLVYRLRRPRRHSLPPLQQQNHMPQVKNKDEYKCVCDDLRCKIHVPTASYGFLAEETRRFGAVPGYPKPKNISHMNLTKKHKSIITNLIAN